MEPVPSSGNNPRHRIKPPQADPGSRATFRCYAELNDFVPIHNRQPDFSFPFQGCPSIKECIEAIGIPHTDVVLILINGYSTDFGAPLHNGDRVSVYSVFEAFNIEPQLQLRPTPLRNPTFVLDAHLCRLAVYLRLLGFDTIHRNDNRAGQIAGIAASEHRIVLTKDHGLLKRQLATHGYCIRSAWAYQQAVEVIRRFDLVRQIDPFRRCLRCNGLLHPAAEGSAGEQLPPHVQLHYKDISRCADCGRISWPGSLARRLREFIEYVREHASG